MADVFLSYARGDRRLAERLANAIGQTGLTVWWDRHIKGGAEFSRDIETQLDILNDGRVTFTPEQRADPRYHELFRHPKLVGIATARRKAGVTAGLPIFPVKPYSGQ